MTTTETGADLPLADELKTATAQAHRHAETREVQKLMATGRIARETLTAYLGQLFLVHRRLETLIDAHPAEAKRLEWSDELRHSARLRSDLADAGVDADAVTPGASTTRCLDAMAAAADHAPVALTGSFYVLEGSMNGNRFIVRPLETAMRGGDGPGLSYLDPYGNDQPARWKGVRDRFNAWDVDATERQAVLDAAHEMFDAIAAISDEVRPDGNVASGV